jgi:hypothetical protein
VDVCGVDHSGEALFSGNLKSDPVLEMDAPVSVTSHIDLIRPGSNSEKAGGPISQLLTLCISFGLSVARTY